MDKKPISKSNAAIARILGSVADLFEQQGAGELRIRTWRAAAQAIQSFDRPITEVLREQGIDGVDRIPGITHVLANAICEIVETGRLALHERLLGESDAVARIASVPGMGRKLAHRVHHSLGIESVSELERAARDGRLLKVQGFGPKRIAAVQQVLATRLRRRVPPLGTGEPAPIAELLDVDREYRERAAEGSLPKLSPQRFNPDQERWLPVLHTQRGDTHYTALFSNSGTAHKLGRTRDWVVIFYDDDDGEHQSTVLTAQRGPLAGRRVVRGREAQCVIHYHLHSPRAGSYAMSSF